MSRAVIPPWTHTHNGHIPHAPGISIPGHYRPVKLCYDPLSGEYLTRGEWRKVYSGGTPDLPPNRYRRVVPVTLPGDHPSGLGYMSAEDFE